MNELIWFSIPGAISAMMIVVVWPSLITTDERTAVWIVLIPMLGFCLHQAFRVVFEWTGGFNRPSRKSLSELKRVAAALEPSIRITQKQAFLIWELTFYGDDFPSPFRDHVRGSWHYILSFWSIAMAAVLASALGVVAKIAWGNDSRYLVPLVVLETGAAIAFTIKGCQTYSSLIVQETGIVNVKSKLFIETISSLPLASQEGHVRTCDASPKVEQGVSLDRALSAPEVSPKEER